MDISAIALIIVLASCVTLIVGFLIGQHSIRTAATDSIAPAPPALRHTHVWGRMFCEDATTRSFRCVAGNCRKIRTEHKEA